MNRRYFDDAEADSLSERFAATTSTRLVRVTAGNRQIHGDRQSDGSTQPARPRHGCDGAWFEIEPQRAPGPMWLLESADRSRVGVVVAGKTLRNLLGAKHRSTYFWERTGMIEADSSEALWKAACPYELKTESTKERSPTELRCASSPARLCGGVETCQGSR